MTKERLQFYSDYFWEKIKAFFVSKEDMENGVLLSQSWDLVESVTSNNVITLPSLDIFDELYIEMSHSDGTIVHKTTLRKES